MFQVTKTDRYHFQGNNILGVLRSIDMMSNRHFCRHMGNASTAFLNDSFLDIRADGIYEISASFIFESIVGQRVWCNLIRRPKDMNTGKRAGKYLIFQLFSTTIMKINDISRCKYM